MPVRNKFHRQRQRSLYFAAVHLKLTFQHGEKLKLSEAGFKFLLFKKKLHFTEPKITPNGSRHHINRFTISSFTAWHGQNVSNSTLMMQPGPLLYCSFKRKWDVYYCHNKMLIPITWDVMVRLCRIIMMVIPGAKSCQYLSILYSHRRIGSLSL